MGFERALHKQSYITCVQVGKGTDHPAIAVVESHLQAAQATTWWLLPKSLARLPEHLQCHPGSQPRLLGLGLRWLPAKSIAQYTSVLHSEATGIELAKMDVKERGTEETACCGEALVN